MLKWNWQLPTLSTVHDVTADSCRATRFPVLTHKRSSDAMKAIGLVETRGLIGLVAATDAMVKAANVEVVKRIEIGGGLVTAIVSGDVGSVRAAVESGARVADQVGELVGSHVIANPAEGVVEAFLSEGAELTY
mgnify:CR=1 FL=1